VLSNTTLASGLLRYYEELGIWFFFRSKCLSNMLEQSSNTNVRSHIDHEFGGHFAGLDNPPALVEDLREIGNYWKIKS
jgi:hypothetical protein